MIRPSGHALRLARSLVWVLALLLAACAPARLELGQLYPAEDRHPVIVIPGLMGSHLKNRETGRRAWIAGLWQLLGGDRIERLALPLGEGDDGLVPDGIIESVLGRDFYGRLIATLEDSGYRCAPPDELDAKSDCVLFAWDWRRDLVEAAARLDGIIERLRRLRAAPDLKVDLVAHSAGGLVARYFLRFGARDVLDQPTDSVTIDHAGAVKTRKAILIAPPHFGSIFGLQRLMRGHRLGWLRIPPEVMATMPSVYQLLPHPDRAWMIDLEGRPLDRDLYEVATWQAYGGEAIFDAAAQARIGARLDDLERFFVRSLRRGKRFHRVLSLPVAEPFARIVLLGGDCHATPAVCLLEPTPAGPVIRLYPHEIVDPRPQVDYERLMLEPGDGRITRSSLLARGNDAPSGRVPFPIDGLQFACAPHDALPGDFGLRHNLLAQIAHRLHPPARDPSRPPLPGPPNTP